MSKKTKTKTVSVNGLEIIEDEPLTTEALTFLKGSPSDNPKAPASGMEALELQFRLALTERALGKLLQDARLTSGLTQRDLARRLNWAQPRVAQIERAENLEVSTVAQVAEALGFDLELRLKPRKGGRALKSMVGLGR